jgi:hypothetical protein
MASTPAFTTTPRIGRASVSTANTARDGTGTIVDVITGASTGTKIVEVVIKSSAQPAASVVTLFLTDGTATYILDEVALGTPAAGSTTVASYRSTVLYQNLVLPNASWKLQAAVTVAPTSGVINVVAFGGDF